MPAGLDKHLGQGLDQAPAVHIVDEDRLAPVGPINDVVNRVGILDSQLAAHEATVACASSYINIKNRRLHFDILGTDPSTPLLGPRDPVHPQPRHDPSMRVHRGFR